jgi:lipoate synthase
LATILEYKEPKDIFEKIIKDADLDNIGRDDFLDKANNLFREKEVIQKIKQKNPDWIH